MQRLAFLILAGTLLALTAAAPAGAAAPVVKTVTKKVPIREGRITESKVRCPRTMVAIAGTVTSQPTGSTFRKSLPSGARTWRFAFGGFVGASKHTANVLVRCVGLTVPSAAGKVNLNVNTVSRGLGVDSLSTGTVKVNCRSGYVPTDWGFDIPPPPLNVQDVLPPDELQVYKALASSRGYAFGLENLGADSHVARMRVRCLQRSVAGKAGLSHSWRIQRVRKSQRIRSGVRTVRHSCARGYLSIGPGHSIDPADNGIFRRSYDARVGSAVWRFDNASGTDRVTTQILCLNMGTSFR